jgi:hypothetical protein
MNATPGMPVGLRSIGTALVVIAAGSVSAAAPADRGRAEFVATHRCAVVERLRSIHRLGPTSTSRDRFLVVSDAHVGQSYVQCIFFDSDTQMHCEASSAAYGPRTDTLRFELSQPSAQALARLGFAQADPVRNYVREIALGTPPDFDVAATLMLSTLHDAYGARSDTQIAFKAPRAILPLRPCPGPVKRR